MRITNRVFALGLAIAACCANTVGTAAEQSSTSVSPPIQWMDHVGLNVTDLQRSADWYHKVLGFDIFHKWEKTWMIRRGKMRVGLFLRPNAKKVDDLDNTLTVTHFAYETNAKGFREAQNRLRKLGVAFAPPEDTGVAYSIFIYDPDGYEIEITTYY